MNELLSKEYSWQYITADTVLCQDPCELVALVSFPSDAGNEIDIYNGESTSAELVCKITSEVKRTVHITPPIHVYCSSGLYIVLKTNITGAFVQWRRV